jgi:hypothetical protein
MKLYTKLHSDNIICDNILIPKSNVLVSCEFGDSIVGIATLYREKNFLFADITFTDARFKILEENNNRFNLGFSANIEFVDELKWKSMEVREKITIIHQNDED